MKDSEMKEKSIEEALKEALKCGDNQGAKELIRMQSTSVDTFEIFKLSANLGNTEILKFMEPLFVIPEDYPDEEQEDKEAEEFNKHRKNMHYMHDTYFEYNGHISPLEKSWREWKQVDKKWWVEEFREDVKKRLMRLFEDSVDQASNNGHCETALYILSYYGYNIMVGVIFKWMEQCGGPQSLIDGYRKEGGYMRNVVLQVIKKYCGDGDLKSVRLYVNSCNLHIDDYEGAMYVAAIGGHLPVVAYLVNNGFDLSNRYHEGDILEIGQKGKCIAKCVKENWVDLEEKKEKLGYQDPVLNTLINNIDAVYVYLFNETSKVYPELLV